MNPAFVVHAERAASNKTGFTHAERELSRLIGAALINKTFCRFLLADPIRAIESGFNGEYFELAPQVYAQIRRIRADSLEEFVRQLVLGKHEDSVSPIMPAPLIPGNPTYRSEIAVVSSSELLSA